MQKGTIKNFFPGGNTAQGFYSFYQFLPYQAERVFIIKGGPGTGKSSFMKKIGSKAVEQGYDLEFHWCSSDNNSLDGLVIPSLKVAILDGTSPHTVDPINPGAVEEIINFGEYWNSNYLRKNRQEIIELNTTISKKFQKTYHYLKIAKLIHDEWESYYLEIFDFDKANLKAEELINQILTNKPLSNFGSARHLFGSALTPKGAVNHLDNLTQDIDKRYIIKGKPEISKSTLTKKIAKTILKHGYDVLYLHCPLDPNNIETIIIPELNITIINDTILHPLNLVKGEDQIIDLLTYVNLEIITQYSQEINSIEKLFKEIMNKAFQTLKQAKLAHDQLEKFYIKAMNFNQIENKCKKITREILG